MVLSSLLLPGCTAIVENCFLPPMRPYIDREVESLLTDLQRVLFEESDFETAEASLPATLKLLEGMILHYPEREDLHQLAAMGFGFYAFAFLEPKAFDIERSWEEREHARKRASLYYERGYRYALELLERDHPALARATRTGLPKVLAAELPKLGKEDVPTLFWFTYGWAGWINLNRTEPEALTNIEKVRLLVERILELDRDYFHATPLLLAGSLYGGLPKFSGYREDGRKYFDEAIEKTEGKFLMARLLKTMYLDMGFQTEEKKLEEGYRRARKELTAIVEAPRGLLPEIELANEIARHRARLLLKEIDDFLTPLPYEIRLCTIVPKGTRWTHALAQMNDIIRRRTGNQARLKIVPVDYLREEEQVKEELEMGACDAASFVMPMHASEKAPAIYLLEMLLYYHDYEQVACYVRELYDILDFQVEAEGYVLLNVLELGFVYVYSRFDIPGGLADIKKNRMKVWILKDHVYSERVVRELGITPNRNALIDVREDLIAGNIDLVYASPLQLVTSGWYAEFAYMSDISQPIGNSVGATIVRGDVWNRIPKEIRRVIKEAALETLGDRFFRQVDADNRKSIELLRNKFGFGVTRLQPQDFEMVRRANDNVVRYLLESGKVSRELYRRFQDIEKICSK
ncbi:MAG: hypothetical protein D6812_15615 [Deltaproteobacteria bacterium]|nr:MAG: hypothetical protein D6812_15615 [Deltaproteobacteria bacterium]